VTAFDAATLDSLHRTREVGIRTRRHPERAITIWIVVVDGAVYVRSVRGRTGQWFRSAVHDGDATLVIDGRDVAVRVVPVTDQTTIDAVSGGLSSKYASSPYLPSMLRADVLSTTLRLDPRQ